MSFSGSFIDSHCSRKMIPSLLFTSFFSATPLAAITSLLFSISLYEIVTRLRWEASKRGTHEKSSLRKLQQINYYLCDIFSVASLVDPITNQISLSEISKKMRNNRISIFSTTLNCNTLCISVQSPCAVKAQALLKKRNALRFCRWVARVIRAMSDLKKWYRCLSWHLTQKYHMSYTKPNT